MRVLVLHSRYLSGPTSGENRVVEDEVRLLREAAHRVASWTPAYGQASQFAVALRTIWSPPDRRWANKSPIAEPFDVLHVHNLFPNLSPTVLRTGIPTVMTIHNFRLACLSATFLRDGGICEDCLGKLPWRGVVHRCYRGSRSQSAVLAAALSLHRAVGTFDRVTLLAAVSQFVKDKLVAGGLDPDRIRVRQNFSWPTQRRAGPGEYYLALGRLSVEKGLDAIVRGWRSSTRLLVVGDGPERARLKSLAAPGVELRGEVPPEQVPVLLRGARALLVPSIWYETSGRVVIEASAAGVPTIASRIGGLPEHVEHGVSGLLVEPGDTKAWAYAVEQLEDDGVAERLGAGAYAAWQERFSPEVGLRSLEHLYEEAVATGGGLAR